MHSSGKVPVTFYKLLASDKYKNAKKNINYNIMQNKDLPQREMQELITLLIKQNK